MSLYRCAACGSKNVVTDTESSGVKYNYAKGAIGTVVLGNGGAVAGIETQTKQVYKCAACGLSLSYAMPEELKRIIDIGVEDAEARKQLKYNGAPVFWDFITAKFPNVESGAADVAIAKQQQEFATKEAFYFDLFKKMISYVGTSVKFDISSWDKDAQKAWEEQYGAAWRMREEEIRELIGKNARAKEILEEETEEKITAAQNEMDKQKQILTSMEMELSSLGFFKMKEKKALSAKIEEQKRIIADISKPSDIQRQAKKENEKVLQLFDQECRKGCLDVWKRYEIPTSPKTQFEINKFLEPLRFEVGAEDFFGTSISEKAADLRKRFDKAEEVFKNAHPLVSGYDSFRDFYKVATSEAKSAILRDCQAYRRALVCLLILAVAKQPLVVDDIMMLCVTMDFHYGSDFCFSRASYLDDYAQGKGFHVKDRRYFNDGISVLKGLGLVEILCLTPYYDSELPKLHNTTKVECKNRMCDTLVVANI